MARLRKFRAKGIVYPTPELRFEILKEMQSDRTTGFGP